MRGRSTLGVCTAKNEDPLEPSAAGVDPAPSNDVRRRNERSFLREEFIF
jgi:hypothetical protein